jgi:hypothetical protein
MSQGTDFSLETDGESTRRRNGLTRIIGSARGTHRDVQPDVQLSLAKIRENLVSGVALEKFETAKAQGRFAKWLERTCRKVVKHASNQSNHTANKSARWPEPSVFRV